MRGPSCTVESVADLGTAHLGRWKDEVVGRLGGEREVGVSKQETGANRGTLRKKEKCGRKEELGARRKGTQICVSNALLTGVSDAIEATTAVGMLPARVKGGEDEDKRESEEAFTTVC